MENKKLEIIKRILMLNTKTELDTISQNVMDSISRECDQDDKEQEEFRKWKEGQTNEV